MCPHFILIKIQGPAAIMPGLSYDFITCLGFRDNRLGNR